MSKAKPATADNPRRLGHKGSNNAATFTVDGITDTLRGWADRLGVRYHLLYKRIVTRGVDPETAIRQGCSDPHLTYITANGETHYVSEWAKISDISEKVIHNRIRRGWPIEEAVGIAKHSNKGTITWKGKTLSQLEWAESLGLDKDLFYARVREWRKGHIPKKDLFRRSTGHTGRPQFSLMRYYKGKRYRTEELAKLKGVSHTWFHSKLSEGKSVYEIMEYEHPLDAAECARRSGIAQRRNHHLAELRRMGLIV